MSTLILTTVFANQTVRVYGTPEKPLFVAADVCRILDLSNPTEAIRSLEDDEKLTLSNPEGQTGHGGAQFFNTVTESGLYALIFKSRKPEAKAFRKWVTSEVLPSIRNTGSFALAVPKTLPEALRAYADAEEAKQRLALENANLAEQKTLLLAENNTMAPKAAFFDCAMTSEKGMLVRDAAKLLHNEVKGGMGEHRLYKWLRAQKWIYTDASGENRPYQRYLDQKWMDVRERPIPTTDHGTIIKVTPLITQQGLVALHRQLLGKGVAK